MPELIREAVRYSWLRSPLLPLIAIQLGLIPTAAQVANPPQLAYSTYIGTSLTGQSSSGSDIVLGFAVDPSGYSYLVGYTLVGQQITCEFLTKLNQAGTGVVWSKCLAVSSGVYAVAVDASGYVYVGSDETVTKLSSDGQQVVYSASLPMVSPLRLVVDLAGSVYILGYSGTGFQPTSGAYSAGGGDECVVKLSPTGVIVYAASLDLSLYGLADGGIAVDGQGEVWVAGMVCPTGHYPVCVSSVGSQIAIEKLDAAGSHLPVSMHFGGGTLAYQIGYLDRALSIAVDSTGSAWIAGTVQSDSLPTTPDALQPKGPVIYQSNYEGVGFVLKLSPSGAVLYGSYLGTDGSLGLTVNSIAVDTQDRPYFALNVALGQNYPYPLIPSGPTTSLQCLVQFTALDGNGGLYLAGTTGKRGFVTTPGSYAPLYSYSPSSTSTGFVAKFDLTTQGPTAQFTSLVNAADQINGYFSYYAGNGAVAPGELVTLYGTGLPSNPTVTFDGKTAPILYSSSTQINTVVPFEVTAPSTVVSVAGVRAYVLPVWPDVPGLFTANGSGTGQLAALNQDGTVNSTANPAKAGSIVSVYLTGVGALSPAIADGQTGPPQPPFPVPVLGSSATVTPAGISTLVEAPILFIGQAPGLIAGVIQANIQIPPSTPTGTANVVLYLGTYTTQTATLAIQ